MRFWRRHHRDTLVCREFVDLVTEYLDGGLSECDRARFEGHLSECDGCSGYLQDMRRMIDSMHDLPEPPSDPETHAALLRAFRELRGQT